MLRLRATVVKFYPERCAIKRQANVCQSGSHIDTQGSSPPAQALPGLTPTESRPKLPVRESGGWGVHPTPRGLDAVTTMTAVLQSAPGLRSKAVRTPLGHVLTPPCRSPIYSRPCHLQRLI
ncbi:hypothetical protein AAFF_G00005430 [Aldrovandia affinis]|uniref:Uncharacterized protein n=1 Tax=Aldrovandia affinis TaxID=143900 RepID=A0AAD7TDL4_9TELE|nr:hypothetical protein AAFF_G00005430 [Aldrovandia affinis]